MIRNKIKKSLKQAIEKAGFEVPEKIEILYPQENFGDYATNVAMMIAKMKRQSPIDIAEKILGNLEIEKLFQDVSIVKPGFINFKLDDKYVVEELGKILKAGDKYGDGRVSKRNKMNVEFISANPTGKLHVGHGRGAFYGDVLSNVLDKAGYKVTREFYINDAKDSKQIRTLGDLLHGKKNPYGTDFVYKLIDEMEGSKEYWKKIPLGDAGYKLGEKIQFYNRQFIEQDLGIHFDVWMSEQSFYDMGARNKTIKWLEAMGLVYKSEGAFWMKTEQFGDDKDRVLIRKTGKAAYFFSDVAYHWNKFDRGFDKLIDIWGADHHGYIGRMQSAVKAMDRNGDFDVLITQLVNLVKKSAKVKMSKRAGTVVDLEWLVEEVGLDAVRFFFLMKAVGTHMDFDVELAKERSKKNPVYYVQYAYARICSIKSRIGANTFRATNSTNFEVLKEQVELDLIKILLRFPEVVEDISLNYEVHRLPYYAMAIADRFHNFYEKCKVLCDDEDLMEVRLALIEGVRIILGEVLDLLGVEKKEKM